VGKAKRTIYDAATCSSGLRKRADDGSLGKKTKRIIPQAIVRPPKIMKRSLHEAMAELWICPTA
jgi:hypothetical protein